VNKELLKLIGAGLLVMSLGVQVSAEEPKVQREKAAEALAKSIRNEKCDVGDVKLMRDSKPDLSEHMAKIISPRKEIVVSPREPKTPAEIMELKIATDDVRAAEAKLDRALYNLAHPIHGEFIRESKIKPLSPYERAEKALKDYLAAAETLVPIHKKYVDKLSSTGTPGTPLFEETKKLLDGGKAAIMKADKYDRIVNPRSCRADGSDGYQIDLAGLGKKTGQEK
jgi:hypothetical protein